HDIDQDIGDQVPHQDRRPAAEDRLHPRTSVERVIGLEGPGELAVFGEQRRQRRMIAAIGISGEQQRKPAAFALYQQAGEIVHQSSLSCASLSISAKASLASRKLSTVAGMPP